ncbi:hypothetical protein MCERE85_01423 [Candidatus Nanopelagicaceae bacterium]
MVNGERALNLKTTTLSRFQHIVIVAALIAPLLSFVSAPAQAVAPSNPTCAEGGVCQIGDTGPGGGKVFYVASTTFTQIDASGSMCTTNCKYLEAAPTSGTNAWTGTYYQWSGVLETAIGTTGTAIGTGYSNTVKMVTQSATGDRAGTISRAYRGPNNLTDWFLPSQDELNELYIRRASVGGFVGDFHWSSSELSSINPADEPEKKAWFQSFASAGIQSPNIKFSTLYVRPIRAFAPLTCAQGGVCQLGDMGPGGGIVFYVSPSANGFISASPACASTSRCKYLEAAPITGTNAWTDAKYIWSEDTYGRTGATATSIGSGYANTSANISGAGGGTNGAGYVSRAYRGPNNLNDWYLPTKDELEQLYAERVRVGVRYSVMGDDYWTSSDEVSGGIYPWIYQMNFPFWTSTLKSELLYVRPIRAFGSAPAEVISVAAIGGVTAPVVGATPVTTVTSANGYTGTVTWSGSPTTFAGVTVYTATITLTAAAGYTLTGVSANFFTVAGTSASATNPINSGVITAAFPATAVGPATKALMTTQPSGAVSGAAFTTQPVVRVTDVDGNTNTSFTGNVVASIASGTGTLGGTTTVAAVSGVATFTNLVITGTLGNFTLRFTPASLTPVTSNSFALEAPPAAAKIAITRAAVGTQRKTAFTTQPQVTIQFSNNETVTASSAVVTASISSGGTLIGTTTATASSGVATFSNLGVDGTVGTTYTISYTALDLPIASATVTLTGTTCDGATFTCQVGDTGPGGGKIFYVAPTTFTQLGATGFMCQTACKYLEAAPTSGVNAWSDEDPYEWSGNLNTLIGTTGTAIGTGYKNTLAMITQSNSFGKAGTVAQTYRGPNSLSDWFLPSKDELNQLCRWERGNNVSDVPCFQGVNNSGPGATGFIENYYWSSSESGATTAWSQLFAGDPYSDYSKSDQNRVRPIRAFGTAPTTISIANVVIPAPVLGATPVNSITSNGQYTTAITWSGSPTTFAGSTAYTATVTVTPVAGYTLSGVSHDFFTVNGNAAVNVISYAGSILGTTDYMPRGIAVDSLGNVYTVNYGGISVTKITPQGVSSIFGTPEVGTQSLVVDALGNVYLPNARSLTKITPQGVQSILGTTGINPVNLAVDALGNVYTANLGSNNVSKITPGGVSTILGTTGLVPVGIAVDSLGNVYTSNEGSHNVTKITPQGVSTILGTTGQKPRGIAVDSLGNVYTSNFDSNNVTKITPQGVSSIHATTLYSQVIAVDALGNVYIPDNQANNVTKITPQGVLSIIGTTGLSPGAVAVDSLGNVYTSNANSDNVTKFSATNSGVFTYQFPATAAPVVVPPAPTPIFVAVAPTPVPYLKTLTTPKLRLSSGKLLCTPGTYNAGYTLDGVIQGGTTTLFTPSTFTYNLLINGVAQTSLAVTSSSTSHSWTMPASTSGALITCSVTVTANGLTNTDKSGDNTSGASSALTTQSAAIATANATYSAALSANTKAYQKALVDNRTQWRSTTEKIRTDYYAERNRINSLPSTKVTRALSSAALKAYTAALKKSAEDYKASGPAALVAKDVADKAALDAKTTAIAKANAAYGTAIEAIGYGVLIP